MSIKIEQRAIIFDFDGVLVESVDVKTRAFCDMYSKYGHEIVEKVKAYHLAHGGISRFEKFRYFSEQLLNQNITEEELQVLGNQFSNLVEDSVVRASWTKGAFEFLEEYYFRVPLYVVSGTPTEELLRISNRRRISHYFRRIYGSPEKKGYLIKKILAEGGYPRERVIMVGDALTDYDGAEEAGVRFIGIVPANRENVFPSSVRVVQDLFALRGIISDYV